MLVAMQHVLATSSQMLGLQQLTRKKPSLKHFLDRVPRRKKLLNPQEVCIQNSDGLSLLNIHLQQQEHGKCLHDTFKN